MIKSDLTYVIRAYVCCTKVDLNIEMHKRTFDVCTENSCWYSSACENNSCTWMIFSVELDNTKVVDNLNIFAALKFDDFRPLGLGAMKF
jgi:hypothetical protein